MEANGELLSEICKRLTGAMNNTSACLLRGGLSSRARHLASAASKKASLLAIRVIPCHLVPVESGTMSGRRHQLAPRDSGKPAGDLAARQGPQAGHHTLKRLHDSL